MSYPTSTVFLSLVLENRVLFTESCHLARLLERPKPFLDCMIFFWRRKESKQQARVSFSKHTCYVLDGREGSAKHLRACEQVTKVIVLLISKSLAVLEINVSTRCELACVLLGVNDMELIDLIGR